MSGIIFYLRSENTINHDRLVLAEESGLARSPLMKTRICWGFLCRLFFPIIFFSYLHIARCDGAPDLAVTKIWHEGRTICFIIQNQGDESAPTGFDVSLFVGDEKASVVYVDTALVPRQRYQACFDYIWECSGDSDNISVHADYNNAVEEGNEDNNYLVEIWLCDTTPPQIVAGPFVTDITQDSAVISWETDEVSRDIVKYGTSPAPHEAQVDDSNTTKTHQVVLNNLESSTTYFYQIYSRDLYDNSATTDDYTFDTESPLPDLAFQEILQIGNKISIVIENRGDAAAPAGHVAALFVDGELVSTYSNFNTPLMPNGAWQVIFDYDWQCTGVSDQITVILDYENSIIESNEDNNTSEQIWICENAPLLITSGPRVTNITPNSATISWITSKPSDSYIKYGKLARIYSSEISDAAMTETHNLTLTNLEASSTYHFKVSSTDESDAKVESRSLTFETASDEDETDPLITLIIPDICEGFTQITADASDDHGIVKVEFYIDGNLVFTDFSPPYHLDLNTRKYANGSHNFSAKAYDFSKRTNSSDKSSDISNKQDTSIPSVVITYPAKNQSVSGDVVVLANVSDDKGLFSGTFYVDGKWAGSWYPKIEGVKNAIIEMPWHTALETNAPHRIGFQVFDLDFNQGTGIQDVVVYNAPPLKPAELNITRAIGNKGNYFTVILTVANIGEAAAANIKIQERLQLFQPIAKLGVPPIEYKSSFNPALMQWTMDIADTQSLPGGQFRKYTYDIVPVLVYPMSLNPIIGGDKYADSTDVWYGDIYNNYNKRYKLAMMDASLYHDALKSSDYLMVTSPRNLRFFNSAEDADALLSKMAELATLRNGVLGYIDLSFSFSTIYKMHWGFAVGNMLGDDRMDLAIGDMDADKIFVYSNEPGDWCEQQSGACHHLSWRLRSIINAGYPDIAYDYGDAIAVGKLPSGTKDKIVMLDHSSDYIIIWDGDGKNETFFKVPGLEPYDGLALGDMNGDGQAEILIAARAAGKVLIYNDTGAKINEFSMPYTMDDGFAAGDVMNDSHAEIITASQNSKKVFVLSSSGNVLSSFNFPFEKGDALAVGNAISSWSNDKKEIILSKFNGGKIYVFNAQGNLLKSFDANYDIFDGLAAGNILGGNNDDVIVGDTSENKILFYNAEHLNWKKDILCDLIHDKNQGAPSWQPQGAWSSQLKEGWRSDGYLLIVGETEIVPAFGDRWYGTILTTRGEEGLIANCTDLPYANTCGDENLPELGIGRIIGNNVAALMKPIQTSIDQIKGTSPKHFDRSNAIVVSGHPEGFGGGADKINFRSEADVIAARLKNAGLSVYQQDNTDWTSVNQINALFFMNTSTADVIFFAGHGNSDGCSDINVTDVMKAANPFTSTCPFVFASSCLTGRYVDGFGIAEAYLNRGAAAYLGATNWGVCCSHSGYSPQFFDRWQTGETLGNAIQETKLFVAGDKYGNYWNAIYHLYGDPKFGTEGPQPPKSSKVAPLPLKVKISADRTFLDIVLPEYQVNQVNETDHISIPGGMTTFEVGMPIVPYTKILISYPRNTQIQDVTISERSDMVISSGLHLPLGEIAIPGSGKIANTHPRRQSIPEWYPEKTMEWTVIENPSSTTLALSLYPFYYNAQTTEVQYYKYYLIAVDAIVSDIRIVNLETNKHEYEPGEQVAVMMALENQGSAPKNVVVSAAILKQGSGELVSGLPLQTLNDFTEAASYNAVWDSAGFEQGYYAAEIEIRDDQGALLDKSSTSFRLGSKFMQIAQLTAAPASFNIGDDISISMTIANSGTQETSGTAVLLIRNSKGELIKKFQRDLPVLSGGESTIMNEIWKTTDEIFSAYFIVGFAYYGGQITEPIEAIIRTKKPTGVIAY